MKNKKLIKISALILIIALVSSGWVYTYLKDKKTAEQNEINIIQSSFVQQYGSSVYINQMVSQEKVYAALWTDNNGVEHVSWNIGGLWVEVWRGESSGNVTAQ